MDDIFLKINDLLADKREIVMARIIKQKGSAPRSLGACCLFLDGGQLIGTIGGGLLEHQVGELAGEVLQNGKSIIYKQYLQGEDVTDSQMLCGGTVTVYLQPLSPKNPDTVAIYKEIAESIAKNQGGFLVTKVSEGISTDEQDIFRFIKEKTEIADSLSISPNLLNYLKSRESQLVSIDEQEDNLFLEPVGVTPEVIIFGAGHISTCLAPVLKMIGFRIIIVDDRSDFANRERFPDADAIHVLPFTQAFAQLSPAPDSYIVIVTRGHKFDKEVLAASLKIRTAYIGMIGSSKKRLTIYSALLEEGFTEHQLEKVYSPIGISIEAETPEEIAISIAAELIQKKAANRKPKSAVPTIVA